MAGTPQYDGFIFGRASLCWDSAGDAATVVAMTLGGVFRLADGLRGTESLRATLTRHG